ncbi:MAG: FtsW/RodA/SpoVE family cell cycle protein [Collinsella sp.]
MNQLLWLFIGCGGHDRHALAVVRNLTNSPTTSSTLMIVGILLLVSPMLPVIGYESGGGQLWLRIGGFSFQPGELAEDSHCVLHRRLPGRQPRDALGVHVEGGAAVAAEPATCCPLIVMWALAFIVVVLENDLGLALVLFSVFVIMLYVATGKKLYLVVSIGLAAIAAVALTA